MTSSVDPDQTPQSAASDQGLHCLLRLMLSNTHSKYGITDSSCTEVIFNLAYHWMLLPDNSVTVQQAPSMSFSGENWTIS